MELKNLTIQETSNLKEALAQLEVAGTGLLFVINKTQHLTGILTDGDIRRALLKNSNLDSSISAIMNRSYTALPVSADSKTILDAINKKIKIIPLVDSSNRLVDFASLERIRTIPVAAPSLTGNELAYVTECIKTNWISSQGKFVQKFEELFSVYHNNRKALAVSNGTVALHLALVALGIKAGDEVIVPNLTFAASINAILHAGATPVLADVDPESWNLDPTKIKSKINSRTKAIMPVHLYGNPCNMDAISEIAKENKLLVIEDAAEALGSSYHRRPVGIFGDAATFSFYGNKVITTGEGGMIVFKDEAVAERAAMLRDHGMDKTKRYWHAEVGFNYRLTNIQAAIGVAQFEQLDEFVAARRKIARTYNETLGAYSFFQTPVEPDGIVNAYWLYTFMIKPEAPFKRESLMAFLGENGVETRPVFYPLHEMPPYITFGNKDELKISKQLSECGLSLPSFVSLKENELAHICSVLTSFVKKFNNL